MGSLFSVRGEEHDCWSGHRELKVFSLNGSLNNNPLSLHVPPIFSYYLSIFILPNHFHFRGFLALCLVMLDKSTWTAFHSQTSLHNCYSSRPLYSSFILSPLLPFSLCLSCLLSIFFPLLGAAWKAVCPKDKTIANSPWALACDLARHPWTDIL